MVLVLVLVIVTVASRRSQLRGAASNGVVEHADGGQLLLNLAPHVHQHRALAHASTWSAISAVACVVSTMGTQRQQSVCQRGMPCSVTSTAVMGAIRS